MRNDPMLWADYPDPDVIRVDDAWYMASTTMHMLPGCDLLRSYNLRDWELVCHVCPDLGGTPAQRLQEENIYGKGMWAPCLRYAHGQYHILFAANDTGRSYHFTAPLPEGPWTERPIEGLYYDASVLFDDDGRVCIAHGNRAIRLTEMKPDLSGPLPGGFDEVILRDSDAIPLGYEGSHLQKIGGRYFLFNIHWPDTGTRRRTQAMHWADDLRGPWQGGDVLDDDMGFHNRGVAQGGLTDTPDGRWYAVLFQDHGAVGRCPVLVPVRFEDGLPVFEKPPAAILTPDTRPNHVYAPLSDSDDFSGEALRDIWQWNHQPDDSLWKLADGALTLKTGRVVTDLEQAPNTLTQRTFGPVCAFEATVDGSGLNNGDYAGLCALQGRFAQIAVCRQDGDMFLSVIERVKDENPIASGGEVLSGEPEAVRETAWLPLSGKRATLRAVFDFRDLRDEVAFFYRDGDAWKPLGPVHKLTYDLRHFMGVRAGLFCYSTRKAGGEARFEQVKFERRNEE